MENPKRRPILVVEDDIDIRETLEELLQSEGYDVISAKNGKEALEILESTHGHCLILLDLMMPVMSGWEFLQELKKKDPNWIQKSPIFILSAANDTALSVAKEVTGLIKKPLELEVLLKTIEKHCA